MQKRICSVCGYVFDENKDGLFQDLPTDWVCPLCKADKSVFVSETLEKQEVDLSLLDTVEEKLSALQISAVCSNLAKGCEKQYLMDEAKLFDKLATYFKESSRVMTEQNMSILQTMINRDLNELFPLVESIASKHHDRGALRAYTWSLKVTTILKSLLEQYENVNAQSFDSTGVYVCTICGFIYVGNDLPALCPICKVPNYKFEEVKGE